MSVNSGLFHKICCFTFVNRTVQARYASTFYKNYRRQEERESIINQYAGKNIKRESRVYGWGFAASGALGVRTLIEPLRYQKARSVQLIPLKIEFFPENKLKIQHLACGYGFTVFSCKNTAEKELLFGMGINTCSQIGFHESTQNSFEDLDMVIEPSPIYLPLSYPTRTRVTHIACGRQHTVIATDTEGIFTLGNNSFGQCGRRIVEGEIFRNSQVINHIEFKDKIKQVVCGQDHTLVLTEDGQVFSCGLGVDGQTGQGHYKCMPKLQLVEGDIKGEKIVNISSKADTALAVSEKGDVFGWGNTEYDQLEIVVPNECQVHTPRHLPFKVGKVKIVAAGGSMCALLNEEDKVFTWGHGILGRGPNADRCFIPEQIPSMLFGLNDYTFKNGIKDIQCGLHYFAVLTNSGNLYTWGKNTSAPLGLGHSHNQFFPYMAQIPAEVIEICCGVDHMLVICKAFV